MDIQNKTVNLEIPKDVPSSQGVTLLRRYAQGTRLTARQSILAQCCVCLGYYVDGREDCQMPSCPLYPYMPYRVGRKKYTTKIKESGEIIQKKENE
jgi:hypothetical protein